MIYLAAAPKSNSVYTAYDAVVEDVENTRNDPVPLHIRNAPTRLMKGLGDGKGYQYGHDLEDKVADMDCLPESLKGRKYFHGQEIGEEAKLKQRAEDSGQSDPLNAGVPQVSVAQVGTVEILDDNWKPSQRSQANSPSASPCFTDKIESNRTQDGTGEDFRLLDSYIELASGVRFRTVSC